MTYIEQCLQNMEISYSFKISVQRTFIKLPHDSVSAQASGLMQSFFEKHQIAQVIHPRTDQI